MVVTDLIYDDSAFIWTLKDGTFFRKSHYFIHNFTASDNCWSISALSIYKRLFIGIHALICKIDWGEDVQKYQTFTWLLGWSDCADLYVNGITRRGIIFTFTPFLVESSGRSLSSKFILYCNISWKFMVRQSMTVIFSIFDVWHVILGKYSWTHGSEWTVGVTNGDYCIKLHLKRRWNSIQLSRKFKALGKMYFMSNRDGHLHLSSSTYRSSNSSFYNVAILWIQLLLYNSNNSNCVATN